MARILKNTYEVSGSIAGGELKDNTLFKIIIEEYTDTAYTPAKPYMRITPCVCYNGDAESYYLPTLAQEVTLTINGVDSTDFAVSYNGVDINKGEWTNLTGVRISFQGEDFDDADFVHPIKIQSVFGATASVIQRATATAIIMLDNSDAYNMSDDDKNALRNNTAAIMTKLIVKETETLPQIILTENNSVKSFEYNDERLVPKQGFIGQFIGRTLDGELHNISDDFSIDGREVELQLGVVRLGTRYDLLSGENDIGLVTEDYEKISASDKGENDTNWYSFGNFLITNPKDDEVADNTKFESMDYAKLFNKPFDGDYTDSDFPTSYNAYTGATLSEDERQSFTPTPVSMQWLARYTCAQVGVPLATTMFTNYELEVDINPFQAGETCRDVMKAIAMIAFSWARVGRDNMCHIDFKQKSTESVDEYDTLTKSNYYSLTTKKEIVGPINGVAFGLKNIDGETAIRIQDDTDGDNILYLYDNPLLYTFDLRLKALEKCDVLFGLTYTQLETETVGHPWLEGNELIDVQDMESSSNYTYPFNRKIKYSGHIRSEISSLDDNKIEQTLGYTSSTIKTIRDASITVNKQEGTITSLTRKLDTISDDLGNVYTREQVNQLLEDELGLTNTYRTSGGANIFKNTGLWYKEGNEFEYWTGNVDVNENDKSASDTVMLLQNSTLTQVVNNIPNGIYTVSFKYEKINPTATLQVFINSTDYTASLIDGEFGENGVPITINTNTIEISFICDTNNGYEVYELMCNKGGAPILWTQHPNEVRTDTVNISKGITITSTTSNATFKANADGIRIENSSKNTTTNFLDDGMETDNATIKKQAKISGALHTIVGRQTWISGIL